MKSAGFVFAAVLGMLIGCSGESGGPGPARSDAPATGGPAVTAAGEPRGADPAAAESAATDPAATVQPADPPVPAVLGFTMNNLAGEPVDLARYAGRVLLIVNTASKCGHTPQYKELQALHLAYADRGLAVLGFPANEFGRQEPGTDEQIAAFCEQNYGVTFDMFSKVVVKGPGQCELYQFLTSPQTNEPFAGPITWNFEKFLVGRSGQVVARFAPKVKPQSPEVVAAIEAELAKSP